ncbi:hypothetical protein [Streptomyces sp. NPDC054863]
MRAGTGHPGSRAALCRLVLVTVLAALLHVLGCAHGPQPAGLERTDTLTAVAPTASERAVAPVRSAGEPTPAAPGYGSGAPQCADEDEPATAGPQVTVPAHPLNAAARVPRTDGREPVPGRAPRCGREGGHSGQEHGRVRAVLGIWRT